MLVEAGLLLILASWLLQLYEVRFNARNVLDLKFVFAYSVGTFLLVMDDFISGRAFNGFLNLCIMVMALAAAMFTLKR